MGGVSGDGGGVFARDRLTCRVSEYKALICVTHGVWLGMFLHSLCAVFALFLLLFCTGISLVWLGMALLVTGTSRGPHHEAESEGLQQAVRVAKRVASARIRVSLWAINGSGSGWR